MSLGTFAFGQKRPNILLITADDMGTQVGCYGDTTIATPRIDQLASEGILFQNAYVTQASCSPSRSSMFTGLYPHQNGQLGLEHRGYTMHRGVPTLPGLLAEAGYRSCAVGKIHVRPYEALPFEFEAFRTEGLNTRDVRAFERNIEGFAALDDPRPWFALASFSDPHKPYRGRVEGLPEQMLGPDDVKPFSQHGEFDTKAIREEVAGYYNAAKRVDIGVGLLMDMLERTGQAQNTLVIFIGDHGPPVSRGKTTTYEFGTRIPFLIRWPERIKPRQQSDAFVSTVDIMPTCLAAAEVSPPSPLAGVSLDSFYRGEPEDWRNYLFTEFTTHGPGFSPQRAVRNNRYKLIHNLVPGRRKNGIGVDGCPIRKILDDPEWKETEVRRVFRLIENPPEYELYDLEEDPLEYHNLAGRPATGESEMELRHALAPWRRETHDPFLDDSYLQKMLRHTDDHLARHQASKAAAQAAGIKAPYNRINMTRFQEDWPTPWMN